MAHLGDYDASSVIYGKFTTYRPSTGAAFTLGGTPALSVYKDGSTTESTTGVTLTADFDSRTGLNHFAIDTSADGTFYAAGSNFDIVITTGTVDSVSVVGSVVASFTIRKGSALKPATAGRTLVVDAAGLADANTVKVGPSGSGTAQTARDIGASVLLSAGTGTGQLDFTSGVVKANVTQFGGSAGTFSGGRAEVNLSHIAGSTVATGTAQLGVNVVSYASGQAPLQPTVSGRTLDVSVGGEAGVDWANVGSPTTSLNLSGTTIATTQKVDVETIKTQAVTAAAGVTFPTSIASPTNITAGTITTVTNLTNAPTAGDLTATMKASVNAEVDTALADVGLTTTITGRIDAAISTRLASGSYTAPPSAATIADAVWDETLSGHVASGSTGEALTAAGGAGDPWITALPGSYSAGQAGYIVGTYLDAAVSSVGVGSAPTAAEIADEVETRTIAAVTLVNGLAANTVTASALAADAVAEIQSGLSTLTAAGVRTAVGLATANLDTQIATLATAAAISSLVADVAALPTAIENADALLERDIGSGTNAGTPEERTVRSALRFLRNKWAISGSTLTVRTEDDTTSAWTANVATQAGADPVVGNDPT
jgi:hypothetical protein